MNFLIADTFTDSLARLTGDEQKAAKTTAFDLQVNAATPGMSFHKLDRAKDKKFWSVRASSDIRIIVHRDTGSLLLCYVGHHDDAYAWAERRKLQTHPTTGAAQLVEIRETVQEIVVPTYGEGPKALVRKAAALAIVSREELLSYGVPLEWVEDVQKADDDALLVLAERLPAEAAEAVLELAIGGKPRVPAPVEQTKNPFEHPDAQRRFRVMNNVEELQQALEFPWDKWTVFLHPDQRQWVERDYSGPARVTGSAGTGKTIVALHRAVFLARTHPESRVLLTTFSHILANAMRLKLNRLIISDPRLAERLEVHSINSIGIRLYKARYGPVNLATPEQIADLLRTASGATTGHKFTLSFLLMEWEHVVDAWQLGSWDEYRDVARLGRKTRLPEAQRRVLWTIFEQVRRELATRKLVTHSALFSRLSEATVKEAKPAFDFAVVDEAQDFGIAHLRFFAALGAGRANALFFAGDIGQRIFQQPFSWLALGIDIRGRSRTLRVNYRTSHQIRAQADRLLAPELSDVDGNQDNREQTVSVFNGPPPTIQTYATPEAEIAAVADWLSAHAASGMPAHEMGLFVRSKAEWDRARAAAKQAKIAFKVLDENVETTSGFLSIATMHVAKGLEFRAVAVLACDDEIIPLQERIETIGDDANLQEVYDTERHLLYVACTRARDHLLITSTAPASEVSG